MERPRTVQGLQVEQVHWMDIHIEKARWLEKLLENYLKHVLFVQNLGILRPPALAKQQCTRRLGNRVLFNKFLLEGKSVLT